MSGLAHFVRDRRRRLHRHRSDSVRDDGTEEDLYHQSLVVDWRRWNDNDDIDDDAVHASAAANDVQKRIVAPAVTASPWRDRQKQDISFFLAQRFGIHPVDDDDDDRNNDNDDDKDSDCDQTGSGACGETKPETVAFAGDAPQPSNPENDDDDDGCLTQQQRQEAPLPTTRPCSNSRRRSTKRQRTKTPFLVVKKPHRDSFLNTALLQFPSYIPAISSLTAAATTTTTTHLSELDLFAPQVDVALCRVQLYWDARETKRMTTSTSRFAPYDFDVRHYQTDGPLVTLYNPNPSQKKTNNNHCKPLDCPIVSLEVEQCRDDPWMTERLVRQTAKPIHGATHRRAVSTTALFLYQAYGRAMHGVLERVRQLQKNSVTARGTNHGNNTAPKAASAAATPDVNLYLSLSGVPSWSVLPLAAVDWYDADVATRYCLCIGDESSLSIIVNDDDDDESTRVEEPVMSKTTSNVSFDHPLLTVGCLIVDDSTGTPLAEYRLTASPSQGAVLVPVPEAGSIHTNKNNNTSLILQQSYQRYFQSKHNSNRGTQEGFAQSTTALLEDGTATTSPTLTAERVDEVNRPEAAVLGVDKQSTASAETGMEVGHLHPVYETENSTVLVLNDTSKNVGTQAQQDDCSYEQLGALPSLLKAYDLLKSTGQPSNRLVSLYAAVLSFTQPSRTKRGDWMMSITLVDDSLELLDNFSNSNSISFLRSVTLNIFVKPKFRASLPLVRYAGDGIRLNDVEIQNWNDNIQLIGTGKSSYVVFRGSVEDPTTTTALALFPTDAENFVTNDAMKGHMLDFWRRSQRRFMLHPTMKPEHCFKLSDLSPANNLQLLSSEETNRRGDLTVMVAAIIPVPENCVSSITPRGFLRVWDGTGPPISDPLPLDSAEAIESIRSGDPPSSTLIVIADIVEKLQNLRQNPDLCPPKALSGRVANVAIWEQEHWQLVFEKVIKVGLFIRLRNVQDRNMGNINVRCLHVHTKSSLTPLPSLNFEVMHLLEEHNNRLLRNEPINPKSGILPLSPNEMLGLSNDRWRQHQTMQNSPTLQSAPLSNNISSVFIGLVKVSRMIPILTIESDQVWEVICPMKTNGLVKIERFYRFGLRLDVLSSAESLDVIVFEDVVIEDSSPGAVLFGMSATDAYNNRRTALRIFHSNLQADRLCKVKITSVVSDGEKYFLLNSLEAAV